MADDQTAPAENPEPKQPRMQIAGQFIRDMSFENVAAQKGISGNLNPEIQVQVNLDARRREHDGLFEVLIKLNIESKAKDADEILFLLEIEYGGLFKIENVPDDQMHPYLMIECPRMIFPYLRRIVSDVTRDGGYPPLNLENIDFLTLYRQEVTRRAEAEKAGQPIA
ncbi:MAG: protein-export chaperone SecB [Paracoccaceae bacterium]